MSAPNQQSDSQSNLRNRHNPALSNPADVVNSTGVQANFAPNAQPNPAPNVQPNPDPSTRPYNIPLTRPPNNIPFRPLHNVAAVTQDLAASGMQVYAYPTRERTNIPHQDTHINEEGYRVTAEGIRTVPSLSFNEVPTATQAVLFPIGGNTVQLRAPVRSNLIARDQFRVDLERANQLVNAIINNTAQGRHPFYGVATTMQLSISRALVNPRSPHNINLAHIPLDPNGASAMHETEEPTQGQMPTPYIPRPPTPFMPARPQTPYHQPQPEASTQPFRPPSPVRPARFPVDDNSDSDTLNNPPERPVRPQPPSQSGTSSDSSYYPASVLPRLPLHFHDYLTRVQYDTQFIDVLAHVPSRDIQAQALAYRRVQAEIDAQSNAIEARKQELSLARRRLGAGYWERDAIALALQDMGAEEAIARARANRDREAADHETENGRGDDDDDDEEDANGGGAGHTTGAGGEGEDDDDVEMYEDAQEETEPEPPRPHPQNTRPSTRSHPVPCTRACFHPSSAICKHCRYLRHEHAPVTDANTTPLGPAFFGKTAKKPYYATVTRRTREPADLRQCWYCKRHGHGKRTCPKLAKKTNKKWWASLDAWKVTTLNKGWDVESMGPW